MSKNKKPKKKNICSACFPCLGTAPIDCDELSYPNLSYETANLEYVIENLCIRKAPKKLVDAVNKPAKIPAEEVTKDFSGYVVRKIPPQVTIGTISSVEDYPFDTLSSGDLKPIKIAPPIYGSIRYPPKRPGVVKAFHAETTHLIDDDTMKQILTPHNLLNKDKETLTMKVSADIHKSKAEEYFKTEQVIPPDIMQTIESLKAAKPLHVCSECPAKDHKNLIKSSSFTSCDKETFCNFSADESFVERQDDKPKKSPRIKRRHLSLDKIDASSSTSDFLYNVRCDNISSDLQTSNKTDNSDSFVGQSLKWKIIINKHKRNSISDEE